jgi:hypothetical protein
VLSRAPIGFVQHRQRRSQWSGRSPVDRGAIHCRFRPSDSRVPLSGLSEEKLNPQAILQRDQRAGQRPCVVGKPSTRSMIPLASLLARVYIPTTFGLSDAVVVVKLESLSRFPQTLG